MEQELLLELYNRYHRELSLYLYSLCHDSSTTEDLLQETFLKALFSLSDSHCNMRAWLYTVARNLCLNHLKKSGRLSFTEDISLHKTAETHTDILEQLIQEENKRYLYQALSILSPVKREVLILQYWGNMSQREISAILKLTPENIRVLAHRAKKELKTYMEVNHYDLS